MLPHGDGDKRLEIIEDRDGDGWSALTIFVDYDDVNHKVVMKKAKELIRTVNAVAEASERTTRAGGDKE